MIEKSILEALKQSDTYVFYNPIKDTICFICDNPQRRLEQNEEIMIKDWFRIHLPGVKVVFARSKTDAK